MAECFPEKPSWCRNEQVCQEVKCKVSGPRCSYHIVGRGVEHPWWPINWVAWQRDHPKWTLGQRHRWALVHLDEFESVESTERTLSGHNENVEAFSYRCMWLWGETDNVLSYDVLMPPIARGQTWLCQPLPVSTAPDFGSSIFDSSDRGLDWILRYIKTLFLNPAAGSLRCSTSTCRCRPSAPRDSRSCSLRVISCANSVSKTANSTQTSAGD